MNKGRGGPTNGRGGDRVEEVGGRGQATPDVEKKLERRQLAGHRSHQGSRVQTDAPSSGFWPASRLPPPKAKRERQ